MKKLIVSAIALAFISLASVQAQTAQQTQPAEQQVTEKETTTPKSTTKEDKVAVKPADLPEAVKKTIDSDQFEGWTVKKAYLVTEEGKSQYYELQVANGKQSARVKLDKNGNNVG